MGTLQQTNLINNMDPSLVKPGTRWSIQLTSERCIEVYIDTVFEDRVRWRYKRSCHNETLESFCSEPRCAILLPPRRKPWWRRTWELWLGAMD